MEACEEVKEFNKPDLIKRISVEENGILFSKARILDSQRFQIAGGLEENEILGIGEFGIKVKTPVLDRYSPLSYSVGDYIHRMISKHGGYETCLRDSLNHCFIIQGMGLFREIGEDCVRCAKLRKKYLDVSMGPIADEQLVIAPPFWVTMCDIYGPCHIYVPGHSMKTRNKNVVDVKAYVLVFVCPTTKMVNLQVIESKAADGVVDGVNRLGCEIGIPSFVLVDQDSAIMKVLKEAEVDLKNLQLLLYKERGIKFRTCPVSGHNYHGAVERKIRTVQDCLDKCDVGNLKLHATGLQTYMKLVENDLNNLPLGYSYGRDSDNSPLLKLIFPNLLKIGRLNTRSMNGPVRMPKGPGELMKRVEKAYSIFFKLWDVTMIPKLMKLNKWHNSKAPLEVDDIVYFKKEESELSSTWTVGKVAEIVKSRDGLVRRAQVQYQNFEENFPRFTDRAARSLVKLFHIDDQNWQDDMAEVEKLVDLLQKDEDEEAVKTYAINHTGEGLRFRLTATSGPNLVSREVGVQHRDGAQTARTKLLKICLDCCCISHCLLAGHEKGAVAVDVPEFDDKKQYNFPGMLDKSYILDSEVFEEEMGQMTVEYDPLMSVICAVNTDLDELYDGSPVLRL